jgi:hypothetical protein
MRQPRVAHGERDQSDCTHDTHHVRMMRHAISPRFATRILSKSFSPFAEVESGRLDARNIARKVPATAWNTVVCFLRDYNGRYSSLSLRAFLAAGDLEVACTHRIASHCCHTRAAAAHSHLRRPLRGGCSLGLLL